MIKLGEISSKMLNLKALLWTGAITHLVATITVYLIGRLGLLPLLIDPNGILRGDASSYLERCIVISQQISNGNFWFLIARDEQIHTRIFVLFFKIFSFIFGENIFAFEFINLTVFLSILFLIYKIGENCFDTQTGLISAFAVNFFPSFLLHTTQPLRDQFYVLFFLAIIFLLLQIFDKKLQLKESLFYLLGFFALFLMIWLIRDGAILLYLAVIFITLFLLILKNLKTLLTIRFNLLLMIILLVSLGVTPFVFNQILPRKALTSFQKYQTERDFTTQQKADGKDPLTAKINVIRFRFNNTYTGGSGSDIDENVLFDSWLQVFAYFPRAFEIGLFAPFPNMWLSEGKFYGNFGRLAAGLETLLMYFVYALAIMAIYYYSRSIKSWFLLLICVTGVLSLGLVVVNIGTLYRTRYILWLFFIILGVKGLLSLWEKLNSKESLLIAEN